MRAFFFMTNRCYRWWERLLQIPTTLLDFLCVLLTLGYVQGGFECWRSEKQLLRAIRRRREAESPRAQWIRTQKEAKRRRKERDRPLPRGL